MPQGVCLQVKGIIQLTNTGIPCLEMGYHGQVP